MTTTTTINQLDAFKLRMRSLTLPVFQVLDNHLDVIESQLETIKTKTPNLFHSAPMVIDMDSVPGAEQNKLLDLTKLYELLKRYGIIPIGVQVTAKGVNAIYEEEAKKAGVAVFIPSRNENHMIETPREHEKIVKQVVYSNAKLITKPVRSGQQVYAEGGDLIIVSSVSNGAELLADGNIHVYGTLRGRALAGIQGNHEARIFCQNLEADLLSIAGCYMISDAIDRYRKNGIQQVYLDNDRLQIESL